MQKFGITRHARTHAIYWLYGLGCLFFLLTQPEPTEAPVKSVLNLVQWLGLPIAVLLPASRLSGPFVFSEFLGRFLRALPCYLSATWAIGAGGDVLYRWLSANPEQASVVATASCVLWLIYRMSRDSQHHTPHEQAAALMKAAKADMPTERDNCYTAAHEAGHVLVYAGLSSLPLDVKVVINDRAEETGQLGFVSGISWEHHLHEKEFAEWYMLVYLAGKFGEMTMYGESTLGASNDHQRWLSVARSYLGNHYQGIYYTASQNKLEIERNEEKLQSLQTTQLEMLAKLFDDNRTVFRELVDELLIKRTLVHADLMPFFARINLPANFPKPKGPFKLC